MRLTGHSILTLIGIGAVVWALTLAGHPVIECRGVVLTPGQFCPNADGTGGRTYEQLYDASQAARPVIGGVGVLLAGFGAYLIHGELARKRRGDD